MRFVRAPLIALPLLVGTTGCTADLTIDPEATLITCDERAECPADLVCDTVAHRCVRPGTLAPRVVVGVIPSGPTRSFGLLRVPLTLSSSGTSEELNLELEVSTCCHDSAQTCADRAPSWASATIETGARTPTVDENALRWTIDWNAAVDAPAVGLAEQSVVDASGDTVQGVAHCPWVELRVRGVTDAGLAGSWAIAEPFDLGNSAPSVAQLEVGRSDGAGGFVAQANTVLQVELTDSEIDAVSVVGAQLAPDGDFAGQVLDLPIDTATFPVGAMDGVATDSLGVPHRIVWDTLYSIPTDHDTARLRIRIEDALGAISAWAESNPFAIDNINDPPVLTIVSVTPDAAWTRDPADDGTVIEVDDEDVTIAYTLSDADIGDLLAIDARVAIGQAAIDADTMVTATTGSQIVGLKSGSHSLTWSRAQAGLGEAQVLLRLEATDGTNLSAAVEVGPFTLDTQPKAPVLIQDATVHVHDGTCDGGVVPITFRLSDPNADMAEMDYAYSMDAGATWTTAREYATAQSSGFSFLRASPLGPTGRGGSRYTFLWDATGLQWLPKQAVFRLTARDVREGALSQRELNLVVGTADAFLFESVALASGQHNALYFTSGDFDDDTHLDLAVVSSLGGDDEITIWLGGGDGTFAQESLSSPYVFATQLGRILAADLSNNDIVDLAVVDVTADLVQVLVGAGDGTFSVAGAYPAGDRPLEIVAADFTGDTINDLAVANGGSSDVSILEGQGAGGVFSCPDTDPADGFCDTSYAVDSPSGLITADFDADGVADLALASSTADVVDVLIGQGAPGAGDGTFAAPVTYVVGDSPVDLVAADANGDGVLDLLVVNQFSNTVSVLLGQSSDGAADGTFWCPDEAPADGSCDWSYDTGETSRGMDVADFNGDDVPDVVVATGSGDADVRILLGHRPSGSDDFVLGVPATYYSGNGPSGVWAADFNADGIPDIAAGHSGNFGTPVAASVSLHITRPLGEGRLACADFAPADGLCDTGIASLLATVVATPDLDGDGVGDLVAGNGAGYGVNIALGGQAGGAWTGSYTVTAQSPIALSAYHVADAAVGDFNDDGALDLAVATRGISYQGDPGSLEVLIGIKQGGFGTGYFEDAVVLPARDAAWEEVIVADVDDDGIDDLVAGTRDDVSIWRGQGANGVGDGTFACLDVAPADSSCDAPLVMAGGALAAADANADGLVDLLGSTGSSVNVAIGQGGGAFVVQSASSGYDARMLVADLNADGVVDVVTARFGRPARVLLGQGDPGKGDGTFLLEGSYGTSVYGIALADMNGDGILDLSVAQQNDDVLITYLGQGDGVGDGAFACPDLLPADGQCDLTFPTPAGPREISVVDQDGDTSFEVAVASQFDEVVTVHSGVHGGTQTYGTSLHLGAGSLPTTLTAVRVAAMFSWSYAPGETPAGEVPIAYRPERPRAGRPAVGPMGMWPLTGSYRVDGDLGVDRVLLAPELGGPHLRVTPRLGARRNPYPDPDPDREGLCMSSSCPGAERALLVNLPIPKTMVISTPGVVRLTYDEWVRSSDHACGTEVPPPELTPCDAATTFPICDPAGTEPDAGRWVARLPRCSGGLVQYDDVRRTRVVHTDILPDPNGDLGDGEGPRFVVNTDDPDNRVVQVLTDHLGVFQAFQE